MKKQHSMILAAVAAPAIRAIARAMLLAASLATSQAATYGNTSNQEAGDAVYNQLTVGGIPTWESHTGIFVGADSSGTLRVRQAINSDPNNVQNSTFTSFTSGTYYGAFTKSNVTLDFNARREICLHAETLDSYDPLYPHMALTAFDPADEERYTGLLSQISRLRCDGLVEFAYEKAGYRCWWRSDDSGNWNIATKAGMAPHRVWVSDAFQGWDKKLTPNQQRDVDGYSNTYLDQSSTSDAPSFEGIQWLDAVNTLRVSYSDKSGVHRAALKINSDSPRFSSRMTIYQLTSGTRTVDFPVSASGQLMLQHYAEDTGGRSSSYRTHEVFPVNVSPGSGGSVAKSGNRFLGNTSCTVSANPSTGFRFVRWTEGGTQVSTSGTYGFNVTSARNLVAEFAKITHVISLSASPSAGGAVAGGGTFVDGTTRTVTATANAGYDFLCWTEGGSKVSTTPSYTFQLASNRALVAEFVKEKRTISLSAAPATGGTVSGGGVFELGSSRTVSAVPQPGYDFLYWTEGSSKVSSSPTYTFTLTSDRTLVAEFARETRTLGVVASPPTAGAVSGGGAFALGSSRTVTAVANPGYDFVRWTEGGLPVSSNSTYTLTLTTHRTLVAEFVLKKWTVSVFASPPTTGTVSGGGSFDHGSTRTVTATAKSGYDFVCWTEGGVKVSTNPSYTFKLTSERKLVAEFTSQDNFKVIGFHGSPREGFTVEWTVVPGYSYQVMFSESLREGDWHEVGPLHQPTEGQESLSYKDTPASTVAARFYRVERTKIE